MGHHERMAKRDVVVAGDDDDPVDPGIFQGLADPRV
jgi:hypothetical protein